MSINPHHLCAFACKAFGIKNPLPCAVNLVRNFRPSASVSSILPPKSPSAKPVAMIKSTILTTLLVLFAPVHSRPQLGVNIFDKSIVQFLVNHEFRIVTNTERNSAGGGDTSCTDNRRTIGKNCISIFQSTKSGPIIWMISKKKIV